MTNQEYQRLVFALKIFMNDSEERARKLANIIDESKDSITFNNGMILENNIDILVKVINNLLKY